MQKVALARALAIRPKALLLDEPLSPLDSLSREELQGQLMALHRQLGTTTVEVTHDQTHARGMADRVGVIRDGELLQVGVVEEVFERPASRFVAEFLGVGNIFSGHARREGAETRVRVGGGMDAVVPGAWAGPVDLCIRPERVRVFRQRPEGMPNVAPARVVEVSMQTPLVRLSLAAGGLEFRALVSMTELRSLGCTAGSDVWFSWPPEDIHVLGPGKP
jgi:ABC-type Fe3+/spermidine/putrescine transport system ATPase subunit